MLSHGGWNLTRSHRFVHSHKLDVTGAEAKVSVGDRGIADTMGFGAQSLFFLDGTPDERLDKLVGDNAACSWRNLE